MELSKIEDLESNLLELKEERAENQKELENTIETDEEERIGQQMKEIDAK